MHFLFYFHFYFLDNERLLWNVLWNSHESPLLVSVFLYGKKSLIMIMTMSLEYKYYWNFCYVNGWSKISTETASREFPANDKKGWGPSSLGFALFDRTHIGDQ